VIIPLGRVRDPERLPGWSGRYRSVPGLEPGLGPDDHRQHHDRLLVLVILEEPTDMIMFVGSNAATN
jgi:hypothetical protein